MLSHLVLLISNRRLELFNHQKFDRWVERGEALAIPSSLKLYNEVRELGFRSSLLTGRSEGHLDLTAENLKKQGFHVWDKLILRYKSHRFRSAATFWLNAEIEIF
jgi:predicted secreted acid phosphatase